MNKIVIIDDGVCAESLDTISEFCAYIVLESGNILPYHSESNNTHGTICAKIMETYCSLDCLVSLKILDPNRSGSIGRLESALEWCISNNIKLIHMSLGTQHYYDIKLLSNYIKILVERNCIMVAAQANNGVFTYPASYPGVIGVRRDIDSILRQGQYTFAYNDSLPMGNNIVATYDTAVKIEHLDLCELANSNSYIAPIITGIVKKYMDIDTDINYYSIISYLNENMTEVATGLTPLQKFVRVDYNEEEPFCLAIIDDKEILIKLYHELNDQGYSVEILSELDIPEIEFIPLQYYTNSNQRLNKDMVTYFASIYNVDILLFLLEERETNGDYPRNIISNILLTNENKIYLSNDRKRVEMKNYKDIIANLIDSGA